MAISSSLASCFVSLSNLLFKLHFLASIPCFYLAFLCTFSFPSIFFFFCFLCNKAFTRIFHSFFFCMPNFCLHYIKFLFSHAVSSSLAMFVHFCGAFFLPLQFLFPSHLLLFSLCTFVPRRLFSFFSHVALLFSSAISFTWHLVSFPLPVSFQLQFLIHFVCCILIFLCNLVFPRTLFCFLLYFHLIQSSPVFFLYFS